MRAIRIHEFGGIGTIRLDELPRPVPAAGEVLVAVEAAGVGPWDRLVREGRSGLDQRLPLILGSDVSGAVAALGAGVGGFALGDLVYGATNDQFVVAMPSTRWSRPARSRPSPRRSTMSRRPAFRSSPSRRGRCCSSTHGSNRDK
jgi:NADPH:quinone reductase-like Zn-dependent oxidoreductase